MILNAVLAVVVAYLLGSIPTGYLLARRQKGIDIREVGGRYSGAKNVFQEVGVAAGIATAVGDLVKGALAMVLPLVLPMPAIALVIAAVAVVAGHIWPVFLQFRGGAGFATTLGVLLASLPRESLILLIPFGILYATVGRRWGLGPTSALLLVPMLALAWWLGEPPHLIALPVVLGALTALRVYWGEITRALGGGG